MIRDNLPMLNLRRLPAAQLHRLASPPVWTSRMAARALGKQLSTATTWAKVATTVVYNLIPSTEKPEPSETSSGYETGEEACKSTVPFAK